MDRPDMLAVKCHLEEGAISETRLLMLRRLQLSELHCKLGWAFNLRGHYQLKYLDKFGDLITFSSEEEFQLALANHLQPEFRILVTPVEPHVRCQLGDSLPAKSVKSAAAVNGGYVAGEPIRKKPLEPVQLEFEPDVTQRPDWEVVFHPDYLRPRTSTSTARGRRRGDVGAQKAARTTTVQASLAGYPSDLAAEPSGERFVHFGINCGSCGSDPLVGWRFKCSQCPNYNLCARCFDSHRHGHGFYRLP